MFTAARKDADRSLEKDVIDELAFDPSLDASDVTVNVKQGIVTLGGTVKFYPEKIAAEKAVKRVSGVQGIAQEIKVEPLGTHVRTDADLAKTALNLLAWDVVIPKDSVTVTVDRGWLQLDGSVEWDFQKLDAERAVHAMAGLIGIENRIVVRQSVSAQDVGATIRKSFERSADLDASQIVVETDGDEVTLRGTVRSWAQHEEATRASFSLPDVAQVKNLTTIA